MFHFFKKNQEDNIHEKTPVPLPVSGSDSMRVLHFYEAACKNQNLAINQLYKDWGPFYVYDLQKNKKVGTTQSIDCGVAMAMKQSIENYNLYGQFAIQSNKGGDYVWRGNATHADPSCGSCDPDIFHSRFQR